MGATKENPRYNIVSTRLTDETVGTLGQLANKKGLSLSRLLSQIVDDYVEANK